MSDKQCKIVLNGMSASQELGPDLVSLTVTENTNMATTLTLRLATKPDDKGAWTYLEDARFDPFTKISVKLGFASGGGLAGALGAAASALGGGGGNDGLEPIFDGYITSVHLSLGSEPDEAHVEVSATDTCVLLSLEEKIPPGRTCPTVTLLNRLSVPTASPCRRTRRRQCTRNPTPPSLSEAPIFSSCASARRSMAWNSISRRTRKVVKLLVFFAQPQLDGAPQSDLAIQFGDQSNLRNFSARLVGQRPLNVKIEQLDVKANSANIGQASDTQLNKLGATDANWIGWSCARAIC